MKVWLVLLLLLPLCTAQFQIECYGEDHLFVRNQLLQCKSKVRQVCYTKVNGDKGCTTLDYCQRPGWTCCEKNRCND
ncbi:uncharacterized protein wu:fj16a03 [Anguilla rostrata]|uniref:Uncharacterized protein n=1 Tax=Anguilla anguilla TaxID=7936 RepID=A0A9D3LI94_ANGAN|nr:uncharacterized protein wu:fj16a03 [Anguilla anguilla]KAG5831305.1 hypothetical protein ANANG_G00302370 [Anguilla anguilla]